MLRYARIVSGILAVGTTGVILSVTPDLAQAVPAVEETQVIVERNTREGAGDAVLRLVEDGAQVGIEFLPDAVSVNLPDSLGTESYRLYEIAREDGVQLVSVHPEEGDGSIEYTFGDVFLELTNEGYVLVRPAQGEFPLAYIDPPWATDENGTPVSTWYEVEGSTLIQHFSTANDGTVIIADPYIRDLHSGGGKKIGQELVFSKHDAQLIIAGAGSCSTILAMGGIYGKIAASACAIAGAAAGFAAAGDKCLAIRAIGPADAPNLVFPYFVRC